MNIISNKKIFLIISGLLVLTSILAISVFGFKYGIDFTGGTLWQFSFKEEVGTPELDAFLRSDLALNNFTLTKEISSGSFLLRLQEITENEHADFGARLSEKFGQFDELRFETIGSVIGRELRSKSIAAFILVLAAISIYIAFAFRKVSRPISSWKYGIVTLLTLFHDALIPAGLFAILGKYFNVEIDTNFIVAILVVIGFSVHDTIVVFDRIRENLISRAKGNETFDSLVNKSVNETIARSINTSLTLVLVLVAIYLLGSPSLKYFVLAIGVGTIAGTYSSIFVASPLLTVWRRKSN